MVVSLICRGGGAVFIKFLKKRLAQTILNFSKSLAHKNEKRQI